MSRKIVLAVPNRDYAARLAEYLRETEPGWDTAAFTHETALRLRLQETGVIDLLLGTPQLLRQAGALLNGVSCAAALVEEQGMAGGEWPELNVFQSLPALRAAMRALVVESAAVAVGGCRVVTVFSAAAGAGKTTVALNFVRQAGERGWRTFYLNLEMLNATSRLFGAGEPDSLSRLLYGLQTDPAGFAERLEQCARHHPYLRTDYVDAPDHPGERAAMTPQLLVQLLNAIRGTGRYDLVVVDPDSGVGEWHRQLVEVSDRVVWLACDDWQAMEKSERLLSYWRNEGIELTGKMCLVRNKGQGSAVNRWNLTAPVSAVLPYISQWKGMEQPRKLLEAAAFCGAVDGLLDQLGWHDFGVRTSGAKEVGHDARLEPIRRGTG